MSRGKLIIKQYSLSRRRSTSLYVAASSLAGRLLSRLREGKSSQERKNSKKREIRGRSAVSNHRADQVSEREVNVDHRVTRRRLLQQVGGAAAAIAVPTIVPSTVFGAESPSEQVRIGFIGVR